MNALPELHPDDLLDKEARGELSHDERAVLDAHLGGCSVCRFERDVRADFRGDFEELARLDAAPPRIERAPRDRRRLLARVRIGALVAAALLVAGVAAAEWTGFIGRRTEASIVELGSAQQGVDPAPSSAPKRRRGGAAVIAPAAASAPDDAPLPSSDPSSDAPADAPTDAPALPPPASAHPAVQRATPVAAPPAPSTATEPPPAGASEVFAQAGDARQRGAYDEAVRLYAELTQRYPSAPEAASAHAIVARLLLDRGDAAGALAHFDAYLRSGAGALREEAMAGRAVALERLGRSADEAAAWSALVEAYPQSVHVAQARARLAALGGR